MSNAGSGVMTRAKLHADLIDNRCMAITRDGTRCTNHKKADSDFCSSHTSLSQNRVDKESGRYIGYAGDLEKLYQDALQDKYLLHLRDEIAILDTRLKDLVSQAKTGVNSAAWQKAIKEFAGLKEAHIHDDPVKIATSLRSMQEAFEAAKLDLDLWRDIERTMEMRRKLVETEQKYMVQTNQVLPYETLTVMLSAAITALKGAVAKYVANKDLEEIIIVDAQREFDSLIGLGETQG